MLYRSTGVLNFAFGAMGTVAVYAYVSLTDAGLAEWLAAMVVVIAAMPAGGAVELTLMRRLRGLDATSKAVATIALLVGLIGFDRLIWGANPRGVPEFLPTWSATISGVTLPSFRLAAFGLVLILLFTFRILFFHTRTGVAMRAMANDRATAALVGIPVRRLSMLAWGVTAALAALSLLVIAPSQGLNAGTLSLFVIPGLAAAVVGDFRSPGLTVVGGFSLGIIEAEAGLYQWTAQNTLVVPFVVLLAVLLWRQRKLMIPFLGETTGRA